MAAPLSEQRLMRCVGKVIRNHQGVLIPLAMFLAIGSSGTLRSQSSGSRRCCCLGRSP